MAKALRTSNYAEGTTYKTGIYKCSNCGSVKAYCVALYEALPKTTKCECGGNRKPTW